VVAGVFRVRVMSAGEYLTFSALAIGCAAVCFWGAV
jgi:hypothetical protein